LPKAVAPGRHIAGHNAAGTNQRVVADTDAGQDDRAAADPDIAADPNGAAELQTGGAHRRVARMMSMAE
jgi:hypothetical protein